MTDVQSTKEVMQALHNRLSTDLGLQQVLGQPVRVYDSPPEDPVFPYVTYGPMRVENKNGDALAQTKHVISLHVWSRYAGRSEVFDGLKAISDALENAPLSLASGAEAIAVSPYLDVLRAPDGRTFHGLLRVHLYTSSLETST